MEGGTGNQLDRRACRTRSSQENSHPAISLILIPDAIPAATLQSNREFLATVHSR